MKKHGLNIFLAFLVVLTYAKAQSVEKQLKLSANLVQATEYQLVDKVGGVVKADLKWDGTKVAWSGYPNVDLPAQLSVQKLNIVAPGTTSVILGSIDGTSGKLVWPDLIKTKEIQAQRLHVVTEDGSVLGGLDEEGSTISWQGLPPPELPSVITATAFKIIDDGGKVRGSLEWTGKSPQLVLYDGNGKARWVGNVQESGAPGVVFNNAGETTLFDLSKVNPEALPH